MNLELSFPCYYHWRKNNKINKYLVVFQYLLMVVLILKYFNRF